MVDHTALLTAHYDLGKEPNLWYLYKDMYTDVTLSVRVKMPTLPMCEREQGYKIGWRNIYGCLQG